MKGVFAISVGLVGLGVAMAALSAAPASAQTIYPLTRAEILAGARFDLKVEFPGAPAQGKRFKALIKEHRKVVSPGRERAALGRNRRGLWFME